MNKSDRRQVDKALAVRRTEPRYCAATLAALHRSSKGKTHDELTVLIMSYPHLRQQLDVVNGCYVPKEI